MDKVVLVNAISGPVDDEGLESFELRDMSIPELPEDNIENDGEEELPSLPLDKDSKPTDSANSEATNGSDHASADVRRNKPSKEKKDSVQRPPEQMETGFSVPLLLCAVVACMGGVLGGFSHGYPSPTLLELHQAFLNGDTVTAFPSTSFYTGLFGVSLNT